ncbi:translation initiation factor IF-2 [Candidatus Gracilibacteria bacterium]|nr:translation initiation factor IF-2 [Candidatus Gracilibacteria bacterium]
MPRIGQVLEELGLEKHIFAKFYEKVMKKPLTAKVVTISDKNLEQIKALVKTNESKINKTINKSDNKVLKSDELAKSSGFLSGLGFIPVQDDDFEIDDVVEEEIKEKEVANDEFVSFSEQKKEEFIQKKEVKTEDRKPFDRPNFQPGKKPVYNRPYNKPYNKPFLKKDDKVEPKKPVVEKKEKIATTSANLVKKLEVEVDEKITVKEFSEKIGVPLPQILKKLIENKIMTSVTSSLDFDTASLIAADLGVILKKKEINLDVESFMSGDLQSILDLDKGAETLEERAPVVTVMGHVDHGKTSLLDYLRKTIVAEGEAGGITQSIGASVAEHNGKKITFIDTPGHELFTSLRARGAKLTNIAVIVIAADDSVMPQTVESINHAKDAGVPIIIAITKIDKPGNNFEQIKSDIAKHGLTPEDRGGDVPVVGISSKTGQGIPDLLDNIVLQAEMLDLKFNPNRSAVGVVLDANKDPKQGVVASVIILTGSLKVGDILVAYNTYGKIKRMQNWKGQTISKAVGGDPIQILGFTEMPEPGRMVEVVKTEKEANQKVGIIQDSENKKTAESAVQEFLSGLQATDDKISELRLILKSDGSSSLEALKQAVNGIQLPEKVVIKIVHSDIGHFGDSDLALAQASKSLLLGFNLSMNALLKKKADNMKIAMKNFDIIYELTDYLTDLTKGMIQLEEHEVIIGSLEILGIFYTKGREMTIGGKVLEGKITGKAKFRLFRGDEIITSGEIISLHKNKDQVKEILEGEECGLKVKISKRIEMGDKLEFFIIEMK